MMMEPFADVEVSLSVSQTSQQPSPDADLRIPVIQQKEVYQRSRKRSADALAVAGYLTAVLILCLALKGSLASKDPEFVKNPPKALVTDFPPTSDPEDSSNEEEGVDKEAVETPEQSFEFPRLHDPQARQKLFAVLNFVNEPVTHAFQAETQTFRIPINNVNVILRIGKQTRGKQNPLDQKVSRQIANTLETMVLQAAEWVKSPSASNHGHKMIMMEDDVTYDSCTISFVVTAARPRHK